MSFADRMQPAAEFEKAVMARLNCSGWQAFPFGQSQLPDVCRERLRRFEDSARRPSLIRWMPDVITFRDVGQRSIVALIDAKVCGGSTPNYAIELSAIDVTNVYSDALYTPTFFVFDDWKVLTPRDARQRGRQGPESSNGSGTPYVLVSKRFGRDFDVVFPPVREVAQSV